MDVVADPHDFSAEVAALRTRIDQRLERLLPPDPAGQDLVRRAMREAALAPGKRLRPLLVLLAARDLGAEPAPAVDAACAIELLHTASLVLDHLPCMDGARLHGGRETIRLEHGEDIALLAAVGLMSSAFGLASRASQADPATRAALVTTLADAVGVNGLVGGQYADLRGAGMLSGADIAVTSDRRIGALFVAAVDCAAVLAGTDADTRGTLRTFAQELGRAFQILDDLLDEERTTDPSDGGPGRSTLVEVIGAPAAWRRLRGHVDHAMAALADLPQPGHRLGGLVRMVFAEAAEARRRHADSPAPEVADAPTADRSASSKG